MFHIPAHKNVAAPAGQVQVCQWAIFSETGVEQNHPRSTKAWAEQAVASFNKSYPSHPVSARPVNS
jgi:hypothetical protein